jgi:hypothetical protein
VHLIATTVARESIREVRRPAGQQQRLAHGLARAQGLFSGRER